MLQCDGFHYSWKEHKEDFILGNRVLSVILLLCVTGFLIFFFSSLSMVNVCEVTKCHLFYLTPKLMLNFIPPRHTHKHPPIFFLEGAILSGFIQERNIIARHFVHIKQMTGVVGENR